MRLALGHRGGEHLVVDQVGERVEPDARQSPSRQRTRAPAPVVTRGRPSRPAGSLDGRPRGLWSANWSSQEAERRSLWASPTSWSRRRVLLATADRPRREVALPATPDAGDAGTPGMAALLQHGRLEQMCPACGRWEAAGRQCSWCGRVMSPTDWYANSNTTERARRMPTTPPAAPSAEYLGGVARWPARWGARPRQDAPRARRTRSP